MARTKMALNQMQKFIRNIKYFADGCELIVWRALAIYHVLRTMIHH